MAKQSSKSSPTDVVDQSKSGRLEAVSIAMQQIEKEFGKGSIMRMGESIKNLESIPVVPTGSLALDIALGVGGFPKGRIVEIYGPEASGKTTVCLHAIANVQKQGGVAAFVDVEHALDPVRAQAIGVNLDDLLISQPDYGEQALEIGHIHQPNSYENWCHVWQSRDNYRRKCAQVLCLSQIRHQKNW